MFSRLLLLKADKSHGVKEPLEDAVKRAISDLRLTQNEVAERIGVDIKTILNIENYRGNPNMQVIYLLIRSLQIDSGEVFYNNGKKNHQKSSDLSILYPIAERSSSIDTCP